MAQQILDTRSIGTPRSFDGHDDHWHSFCFRFESYAALLGMDKPMQKAAEATDQIDLDTVGDPLKESGRQIYHLLVQLVEGKSRVDIAVGAASEWLGSLATLEG